MGIQTGSYHRPTYQPAAPRFAGGGAGNGTTPKPPEPPQVTQKMGFFKTIKETFRYLKEEFKNKESRDVLKGFSMKHLPEIAMSGLCALPGVGWVANMVLIPISMRVSKKGGNALEQANKNLDKEGNKTHRGLRHLINLDKAWNDQDPKRQYFSKPSSKNPKRTLSNYLATKYNKAIKGIFHKNPALVNKLQIDISDKKFIYRNFERWTEAGQSLRQTRFLGRIFRWMSGVSKNQMSKAFMSRFVRLFFLVPRVTLQGIFYLFKKKPKFP